MSTKSLLARAATQTTPAPQPEAKPQPDATLRIKKTITLAPKTVKALHKLKAHIAIEEDGQTDFGRIIDDAVSMFLKSKGLSV